MAKKEMIEVIHPGTGEVMKIERPPLNTVLVHETIRKDGSRRIQQDFQFCPTMAEQHSAHETDINYLIRKHKPDELAAYLFARAAHRGRTEITGHDFSAEPDMQESLNVVARSRAAFFALPEHLQTQFKNHLEFLKFLDNPQNVEKMKKLGLLTQKQLDMLIIPDNSVAPGQTKTPEDQKTNKKADDEGGQRDKK